MRFFIVVLIFTLSANADVLRLKNGTVIEDCIILAISESEIKYSDALGVRVVNRSDVEAFSTQAQSMNRPILQKKPTLRLLTVAAAMALFSYSNWTDAKDLDDDINDFKNAGLNAPSKYETRRDRKKVVAFFGALATTAITIVAFQDVAIGVYDDKLAVNYCF